MRRTAKNTFVLCNNIAEIDDSVYDGLPAEMYDEICQWYITDCSETDKEYLENTFGLLFTYSEKLGCLVLMVDNFDTEWEALKSAAGIRYISEVE